MNARKQVKDHITLKPIATEKAIMMIEARNVLTFQTNKEATKEIIKKEIEELLEVKIKKIRTSVKDNKKTVYAELKKDFLAIDAATKLGLM